MWNRLIKNEKGFTGLEAAIVLVAFVVVAAVFSYVMLGAGFYTTQKSQEVVHTSVQQASSSLAPSGDIIVLAEAGNVVENITFYVTNTAGGSTVDLNKTLISFSDKNDFVTKDYNKTVDDRAWEYTGVITVEGDAPNLIEKGEKYKVVLNLGEYNLGSKPGVNENIKIEVKPPEGAVLVLERTMPPALTTGNYYAVY
ncbi:archaellin/type IV pilin N-terminal domain-containing protein [Methanosarcina sp. 2.H.A.1B.4]|uniref:archaellin/type IV pilin N-terminal domain-containing protein n=1 Tax=Methanosarcina sp. 2.H.A.1B.4 TaxID=1483600 RepID=UPI000621CFA6|nr:archaellin/type IV pilin N-terminal domain-containing protein [Methanosarcina sp. 2.H.A.1B.4]KKG10374.1 flagellin [Methanosarcina sp. 2.H.A.1B.4]